MFGGVQHHELKKFEPINVKPRYHIYRLRLRKVRNG